MLDGLFTDYTLRTVAIGAAMIGVVAGSLGTYAVLRRQSLLGDAISHAALPGIALAFLLTGTKAPLALTVGAALAGFAATLAIMGIVRATRVPYDAALGLALSVFFGAGLVLLTLIQRRPDAAQAGLDAYLFGQAAALLERDLVWIGAVGGAALLVTAAFWKEFKLLSFDPDFGATLGLRMRALDVLLTGLLVVAIVIGLQTVGVVLMSAMVVAPAAAARQWSDRLGATMGIAAAFAALAGIVGAVISTTAERVPTGPTIVLCLTALVAVSLLLAPRRGLVWRRVSERRRGAQLRLTALLGDLDRLAHEHGSLDHAHSVAVLQLMRPGSAGLEGRLEELRERGWARRSDEGDWSLTQSGRAAAEHRRPGGEEGA